MNGQAVRDFRHLIDLVEESDSKFVRIEYGIGRRLVLDREDALSAGPGILEQYGVVSDRYVSRER